jgi:hypothetical protein
MILWAVTTSNLVASSFTRLSASRLQGVEWSDDERVMKSKGFVRMRQWPNQGTIPTLTWNA